MEGGGQQTADYDDEMEVDEEDSSTADAREENEETSYAYPEEKEHATCTGVQIEDDSQQREKLTLCAEDTPS
ncbi:hypothetical protein PF004_g18556 [Phytophthora fragariae]|uniref:Uncharacterized protein n=1 Tax=Phytophthora fragariae TaxID=53985 RepID=A0A6G0NC69_9STRA|nr:hypothetical protein PF004_g18556 [Phytophthora fragariae]